MGCVGRWVEWLGVQTGWASKKGAVGNLRGRCVRDHRAPAAARPHLQLILARDWVHIRLPHPIHLLLLLLLGLPCAARLLRPLRLLACLLRFPALAGWAGCLLLGAKGLQVLPGRLCKL